MTPLEQAAQSAILVGDDVTLALLGGELAVYAEQDSLVRSRVLPDVIEALLVEWAGLREPVTAETFIAKALRENRDRLTLGHLIECLATNPLADMRSAVLGLDATARDTRAPDLVRTEAASGVVRFAMSEPRWRSSASALIVALEDLHDELAVGEISRLAALVWEQFRDDEMIALLERLAAHPRGAYERGMVGLGAALDLDSLAEIADGLDSAYHWLERALALDNTMNDARMYALIADLLRSLARALPVSSDLARELRGLAISQYQFGGPSPGAEWFMSPADSELEWIPIVEALATLSSRLTEPSWWDASAVLGDVARAYASTRSVRPGANGVERVVQPAIEAAFARERGLLAHFEQWLSRGAADDLPPSEVDRLRRNISERVADSGKPRGTPEAGHRSSHR